ncbi:MAG: 1-phosphofructokinase family hexose kinase [Clostridium sp.]
MITILTFNPSIDKMYRVNSIEIGEVQRVISTNCTAGGKGLNVAKVCKTLGENPLAMGFLGGFNGEYIKNELKKLDIKNKFTNINQETRNCLNIIEDDLNSTEFLEKGPVIEASDLIKFESDLDNVLKETKILVASGSYCQNMPLDYYRQIGYICKNYDIKFILDTSGEALKVALESNPYLIKPNTDEIKQLLNINVKSKEEIISAGMSLIEMGAQNVCISLGKNGMIYLNNEEIYEVTVPKVEALNTVGSGDSTIGGFSVGILRGYDTISLLKLANACGISNALNMETGFVKLEEVDNFLGEVQVKKLEYIRN